jgi:transposase
VCEEGRVATRAAALRRRFSTAEPVRVVLEAGTHSPWVSRLLAELGHEVIVANPRKLRFIYANDSQSDRVDAEYLARVGRLDQALLAPLTHRSVETQTDLALARPTPQAPCFVQSKLTKVKQPRADRLRGSDLAGPTRECAQ